MPSMAHSIIDKFATFFGLSIEEWDVEHWFHVYDNAF
jgi:hypothetical protein